MPELSVERLKEVVIYDRDLGVFRWLHTSGKAKTGSIAGSVQKTGYLQIGIDNKSYLAHRLAWLYEYGHWPKDTIDHHDKNPLNNRLNNLREATYSQNNFNKVSSRMEALPRWVYRHGKKFKAQVRFKNITRNLGQFDTPEAAYEMALQYALAVQGDFCHVNQKDSIDV